MTASHSSGSMLEEGPDLGPAGVVDQPVDSAEALDHLLDQASACATVRDVGGESLASAPASRARATVRSAPVGRSVVVHGDARAFRSRLGGDLGADPAAAAGDQHDPAGERIAASAQAGRDERGADATSSRRRRPAVSGGRIDVFSMTPSSFSATFVRAR